MACVLFHTPTELADGLGQEEHAPVEIARRTAHFYVRPEEVGPPLAGRSPTIWRDEHPTKTVRRCKKRRV